jgi:uracil phosphoribosyltransferase
MHIHNLSEDNTILNTFISEMRDIKIQKDRMRFRRNIERIGEILGYEMSKTFHYHSETIETPLGQCKMTLLNNDIVLCSILRAGVPLHNGLLNYFDDAENAFISAYRYHKENPDSFEIIVEYLACPNLEALKPFGNPKNIHLVSVIGAQEGVDYVNKNFREDTHLWIAAIDQELNEKGYIIPGLGDAGDLAFGEKLQN